MSTSNIRLGILLMIATTFVFALQDGISRHLAGAYNVMTVVMFRYWFFAAFAAGRARLDAGSLKAAFATQKPALQIFRGVLLVVEICFAVLAFTLLGLVESHAIFACYPLIIAALSGPLLGEQVGWRRWIAILIGFIGILVILRPGVRVFSPEALIPLLSAAMFALYGLLTRYAARYDSAETSFLYTGVAGAAAITLIGPFFWEPMVGWQDWTWMGALCLSGVLGHYLLIRAYDVAEASVIQPFAYFQLVFASALGIIVFDEVLDGWTALGAGIITGAGLYTLWREHIRAQR